MNEYPVLGEVTLGYTPMIDRHRAVTAMPSTSMAWPEAYPTLDSAVGAPLRVTL